MPSYRSLFLWLVKPVLREDEDSDEEHRKWLLVPVQFILFCLRLFFISRLVASDRTVALTIQLVTACFDMCFLGYIFLTKRLPLLLCECELFFFLATIVITDIRTGRTYDAWAAGTLLTDVLLLTKCRKPVITALRAGLLLHLAALSAQDALQFGLYDLIPGDGEGCNCSGLVWHSSVVQFVGRSSFFLVDFALTRGFADGMYEEQARMKECIATAERVASEMVCFDLDAAEKAVDRLDGELGDALYDLLQNLREYRPYLPDYIFHSRRSVTELPEVDAPCGKVTVVFTDIEGSTALWESYPELMRGVMDIHNSTIRSCITGNNGYEVKTIGDSFMVAFQCPEDAVYFSLDVQCKLYQADWPLEILSHPSCHHGLRVRVGVHHGEVDVQVNPITKRSDYFGTTVNTAARIESLARGGVIAVSAATLDLVPLAHTGAIVESIGNVNLKGLSTSIPVSIVVPEAFPERLKGGSTPVHLHRKPSTAVSTLSSCDSGPGARRAVRNTVVNGSYGSFQSSTVTLATTLIALSSPLKESCFWGVNTILSAIVEATDRTEGSVGLVFGASVVVVWNSTRRVASHPILAVRFAGYLQRSSAQVTVGVATGVAVHGNAGTAKQRFVTLISRIVDLSGRLSAGAVFLGTFALVAAEPGASCAADDPQYRSRCRPVDRWELGESMITVYEASCLKFCEKHFVDPDEGKEWGWSEAYWRAFQDGDHTVMEKYAAADKVVSQVVLLLCQGGHIRSQPIPIPRVEREAGRSGVGSWCYAAMAPSSSSLIG